MKKTLIGVLPLVDPERNSFWMHPGYLHGIEQAGGLPVVLPMTMEEASLKQLVETMDGFLFTSGQDVSPELYGEAKGPHCGQCLPQRDEMEIKLLEMVLGADKPMLGICRGLQLLNVAMGGKLYQHLSTERPSDVEHFQSPPYDVPAHKVRVGIGSPLHWGLGVEELNVTSYHHGLGRGRPGGGSLPAHRPLRLGSAVEPGAYLSDRRGQPGSLQGAGKGGGRTLVTF